MATVLTIAIITRTWIARKVACPKARVEVIRVEAMAVTT